uniref:Uncharacterized protein n=1 Tax=Vitis vinifera TaxID=29760 RepID=A5BMA6_VITVI|nr:hypothetical protein VITISV_006300 [Vitis vinifera]
MSDEHVTGLQQVSYSCDSKATGNEDETFCQFTRKKKVNFPDIPKRPDMVRLGVRLFGADILVSLPHSSTPPSSSPKAEILDSSNVKAHTTDQIRLVPKMNFCVEPMHFGTVLFGKPWCSKQAIYSKGFTGRVKFFSVHDPTQVCYYISEVLDAGLLEPLFKQAESIEKAEKGNSKGMYSRGADESSLDDEKIAQNAGNNSNTENEKLIKLCSYAQQEGRGKENSIAIQPKLVLHYVPEISREPNKKVKENGCTSTDVANRFGLRIHFGSRAAAMQGGVRVLPRQNPSVPLSRLRNIGEIPIYRKISRYFPTSPARAQDTKSGSKIVDLGFVKFKSNGTTTKRPLKQIQKTQGAKEKQIFWFSLGVLNGFSRKSNENEFSRKSNENEFSRKSNGGWIFLGIKRGLQKK